MSVAKMMIASGCLALAACGGDFDPGSRVTKLRLLAVQATPTFAQPGEDVKLEALAVDPRSRTISWGFATCVDPASSGVKDCIDVATPIVAGSPTFSTRVPTNATSMVGVVVVACPGTITAGNTQGVPIACVAEGRALRLDEFEIGVKRIFVSKERNANPTIKGVSFDGAPWPETETREVDACATDGNRIDRCDDSEEHAIGVSTDVETNEQTVVEYYATEGIFEHDVRIASAPQTKWAARTQSSGSTVTLFMVVRDSRGGVSWTTRQVHVRPRP
ncbi:MAG: hypothetical protein ACXWUG_08865 [Polyangiales bacterium]